MIVSLSVMLIVPDAERAIDRDVREAVDHELPWGVHRQGAFTDPFGHRRSAGDRWPLKRHLDA